MLKWNISTVLVWNENSSVDLNNNIINVRYLIRQHVGLQWSESLVWSDPFGLRRRWSDVSPSQRKVLLSLRRKHRPRFTLLGSGSTAPDVSHICVQRGCQVWNWTTAGWEAAPGPAVGRRWHRYQAGELEAVISRHGSGTMCWIQSTGGLNCFGSLTVSIFTNLPKKFLSKIKWAS